MNALDIPAAIARRNMEIRATLLQVYEVPQALLDELGELEKQYQEFRAAAATPAISASGFRARLHGSQGAIGSVAGILIFVDPKLPDDVVELRDPHSDRVLGRIINVGRE